MNWMAWTWPTALFFASILFMLIGMTIWEVRSPTNLRRGFLPMPTTRGDRFFISLLLAAFGHLALLGLSDLPLWWATLCAVLFAVVILRWG
ncbi:MAG: DUF2160 domain-containing protein [Pseudomonadales bacterium]